MCSYCGCLSLAPIAQIAPGGNFFDSSQVNCDNPFMSAQQSATLGCTPGMIAAGDTVKMEMSPYDLEKARITFRMKETSAPPPMPQRRRY